jgi:GMP synthase (glutamine-hydrolysing)
MTRALVLQHIRCEPPGMFSGMLTDRGLAIETIELDEGAELPDWRDADLVLAMGGPMSVHDEAEHPWLAVEKRWIAAAVRAGVPYFGVCLGAQLLAASLGAPVHTGETPFHVEVTEEMLAEWAQVPAYQRSAEAALGSSGFEILTAGFAAS